VIFLEIFDKVFSVFSTLENLLHGLRQLTPFLPTLVALLGLLVGRVLARKYGFCPSRGGVWGSAILPLLTLPLLMAEAPLVFCAAVGAGLGSGLAAHRRLKVTALATFFGACLGTLLTLVLF